MLSLIGRPMGKFVLMHTLSVPHHARYDARLSPAQPGEALSPTERKLDERFDHKLAKLIAGFERALQSERVKAIAAEVSAAEASCLDIERAAKNDMRLARLKDAEQMKIARDLIHDRRKELDAFKDENLLKREAHYHHPLLPIGVIAFAGVVETLFNAHLFATVSKFGLMGGAMFATALTLPNLGLGFVGGFCGLRYRHHVKPALRAMGTAVTAASFSAGTVWNIYVANVRAVAELRAHAGRLLTAADWPTFTQIFANPQLAFASPHAVLLLGVGLATFAVAVHDGHHLASDPYPGFAAVDRKWRRAIAAAHALKWRLIGHLGGITKRAITQIDARIDRVDKKSCLALKILARAQHIITRFNKRAANHLAVHRAVVREYQGLNRRLRPLHTIPKRFDAELLPKALMPEYDWVRLREGMRAAALSAARAADTAAAALTDHMMSTVEEIEREALDASPSTPFPEETK